MAERGTAIGPACLLLVSGAAFGLQTVVMPPLVDGMGLVPLLPLFGCGVVGLTALLLLAGWGLFGQSFRSWHVIILIPLGGIIGLLDGFTFLWLFGGALGLVGGGLLGGIVFVGRYVVYDRTSPTRTEA